MNNHLRRQQIIQLVDSSKLVNVELLARQFSVSVETIRRDLNYLEKMGRLIRTHGGAKTIQCEDVGDIFKKRCNERIEAKQNIAEKAIGIIEKYMTISLDASSTDWFLAKLIPNIPLTVITNSFEIIKELSSRDKIQVICVGGDYNSRYSDLTGDLAQRNFLSFHIHINFISCFGVNSYSGLWENSEKNASLKQIMIKSAKKTILLADSTKFGRKGPFHIANWSVIKHVISDEQLDKKTIKHLHSLGVQII